MEQMTSIENFIPANYGQVLRNSFLISCDMAHAVNPLYEGKYQDQHKPQLNGGVVIKMNANQRYTSNPATTFALRRLAEMAGIPIQEFEVRNDSSCGSTVRGIQLRECSSLVAHSIRYLHIALSHFGA
jgi:aspartyl aminopeptidase